MDGFLLAIFGASLWGMAPIFGKLGLVSVDPITALGVRSLIAAALTTLALVPGGRLAVALHLPLQSWLLLGMEAMLAAVVGDLAYYAALKAGNAGTTALVMAAAPVVTVWAAAGLLGEELTWTRRIGGLLIALGLALVAFDARE